ncbi:arsenosugar biosynthesis radical SAM protein ArsS [bacterium]|nr:arsenosugar biosynthesis radical SAM protein ArsS [bacterium]
MTSISSATEQPYQKNRANAFPALNRGELETLQVNLGYRCNQSCSHCHVNAGPWRTEMMEDEQIKLIPKVLQTLNLNCLDLTGGAPELHPQFRSLVQETRGLGVQVIDRCNLTILQEPGQEDLAAFLANEGVKVVASLPCFEEERVDHQRGLGVFQRSISGLQSLNALGYGMPNSELELDLVFNPSGAQLPPAQGELEHLYRNKLLENHGIHFSKLLTITNMPIQRFAQTLKARGELETYYSLLHQAHRDNNLNSVMCRSLISVSWTGTLFDCDFNQQLGMPMRSGPTTLDELLNQTESISDQPIAVGAHCFGCTAGGGSSCGGALN